MWWTLPILPPEPAKNALSQSLKEGMYAGLLPIILEADVHTLQGDTHQLSELNYAAALQAVELAFLK